MTQADPQTWIDGVESSEQETASTSDGEGDAAKPGAKHESESVTAETRTEVLERDGYRCQTCGREGPEKGGLATLHVHHIEREPDKLAENGLENLTTLCRLCHNWFHQQAEVSDAPVTLTEADLSVLLPQDIEILRFLAAAGPARTSDVVSAVSTELSVTTIRERLSVLMGLDNLVASRDRQIVDKDVETGEWGLVEQIEYSARGHIPDDPQTLLQRMEDEHVRRALDRGCDRQAIMDVLDVSRRTTFHKEKRAHAYGFPLDAFRRGGGRPPVDEPEQSPGEQQQRSTDPSDGEQGKRIDEEVAAEPESDKRATDGDRVVIQEQLQAAIAALQEIDTEL